jgi:pyruvate ferredoxin oxidoreductase alpha subunit
VANRTLSVPVNIWADHQDTLVNRDCGWIQIYTGSVQEVYDLILMAFRISEDDDVCFPVMVCYDGFILSHASEVVETIDPADADAFTPEPGKTDRPIMDPEKPLQFGEVLFPNWYPEFEFRKHRALANSTIPMRKIFAEFGERFGREYDLIDTYRCEGAEIILLGIGSMMCTARSVVDSLRDRGQKVGLINIRVFRPFPEEEIAQAVGNARMLAVLDRDIGYGSSGIVFADVARTICNRENMPKALDFIIGLGGKDIVPETIEKCVSLAGDGYRGQVVFWPDAGIDEETVKKPGVISGGFGGL